MPCIQGEPPHALAQRHRLAQPHHVETRGPVQVQHHLGRSGGIVCGPIRALVAIDELGGAESRITAAHVTGVQPGRARQVRSERCVQVPSHGFERRHVVLVDQSAAIGRQVQQQARAAPHRDVIQLNHILRSSHQAVLAGVIEPARPDGHVAFGRNPMRAVGMSRVELVPVGESRAPGAQVQRGPAGIAGDARFVAHPAHFRPHVAEHDGVGLQLPHQGPGLLPAVVSLAIDFPSLARAAIVAVAAVGPVEPDLVDRAVLREQLAQLVAEVGHVFRPAVVLVVAVPGRKVDAELQAVPPAGVGNLAHHVPLTALPGAVLDRVLRVLRRPQAEAVVMLGREDQPLHACLLRRAHNLVGVERAGIEDRFRLIAVAPFLVGEGIHREVQKAIELQILPRPLSRAGQGAVRLGRVRRQGNARHVQADSRQQQSHCRAFHNRLLDRLLLREAAGARMSVIPGRVATVLPSYPAASRSSSRRDDSPVQAKALEDPPRFATLPWSPPSASSEAILDG